MKAVLLDPMTMALGTASPVKDHARLATPCPLTVPVVSQGCWQLTASVATNAKGTSLSMVGSARTVPLPALNAF